MKTLLEVLLFLMMLLAGVSITMGILLFQKRELLMGRTQKLEQAILKAATTVEADDPAEAAQPEYPARDLDVASPEPVPHPRRSDFWDKYAHPLEREGAPTLNYSDRLTQLATYYQVDPITLDTIRDPVTGQKITSGPGTMQELLDAFVTRSSRQFHRLNETRHQLRGCREELVSVISDLNARKQDLRAALGTIMDRDRQVARLQEDVHARDFTIRARDESIVEFKETLTERDRSIAQNQDTITELTFKIQRQEEEIGILVGRIGSGQESKPWLTIPPGVKGSVAKVNKDWNFVMLRLSPDFAEQYNRAMKRRQEVDRIDFMIMRTTSVGRQFVSKVNLTRYDRQKGLAVANIQGDWSQSDIREGDMVYF